MTDTLIIGQMDSGATIAQGAVGLAASVVSMLVWSLAQVRTAVSAIVSKYVGLNKVEEVKSLIPFSLLLAFLLGVLAWVSTTLDFENLATFLLGEPEDPQTLIEAGKYYQIRAIGLPFSLFIAGCFGIYRGLQNTIWAMWIGIVGGLLNIVLDIVLVHGYLVEPMGVEGAAWASVISQGVMVLLCVVVLEIKTPFSIVHFSKRIAELNNLLKVFFNMLIRTLAVSGTFVFASRYANYCGTVPLAAYSIGINIWLFSSYFIDGFSNAANAISGKLLGANNFEALNNLRFQILRINLLIAIGLSLLYVAIYPWVGTWFNSSDPLVVGSFNSFFWIVILMQPFNSIAFTYDGIFKGLGEAVILRNTLLIGTFGIFVPVVLIGYLSSSSIFFVWAAFALWMIFRGVSLHVLFGKKFASIPQ